MLRGVIIVGVLSGLFGCRGGLAGGMYRRDDGVMYRVVEPAGAQWRRVNFDDNDLAWLAGGSGHLIAMNATCTGHEDPPLDVLTNHLVIGFTDRQFLSKTPLQLDGRDALRSRVDAKLDGVPTSLDLVVLKKNGCVHDFTYVSPRGQEGKYQRDFDALVSGFRQERAP
jgi:hypothetical protein